MHYNLPRYSSKIGLLSETLIYAQDVYSTLLSIEFPLKVLIIASLFPNQYCYSLGMRQDRGRAIHDYSTLYIVFTSTCTCMSMLTIVYLS